MCGIIGAVAKQKLNPAFLINSLKDLEHRGPDANRFHILDGEQLYFGHTRLKIIDRSDNSNQPLYSPCGRWSIIFNGEIYNYKDLRREIGNIWKWQTSGDTEVLMAAWSLWGLQCLKKIVGMFAFAVYDKNERRLFLVRDRFGIKPLYFSCIGSNFFFSSEIKPLLRIQTMIKPNESAIRTYLEIGLYDHTPATFFQNIQAVKPGTCIEYNLKEDYKKEYSWYSLEKNIPDLQDASEGELLDKAEHLILQAVSSHLVADVGVGLNVSGGVDSSMLISAVTELVGSADLFMQDYAGYSELPWLKETADLNRLNIISLSATDILTLLKETVKSQCEPFGGVFVCGYHALYQRACQKGVTVLLDGNGVDETFLGYERYHRLFVSSAKNSHSRQKREKDYDAFWGGGSHCKSKAKYPTDSSKGIRPEALSGSLRNVPLLTVEKKTVFKEPVRQKAFIDIIQNKLPRTLRFNDRASMALSRELRVPFLDHRLVEFAFGVPLKMLINQSGTKALFRKVLAKRTGNKLAFAAKRAIQTPQREWMAGSWQKMVEKTLLSGSFADRGWVRPEIIKPLFQEYKTGKRENSFFLWQWLNLEMWARTFFDEKIK